ncbi:sialidase family protein, partial [Acinetobacter baumannii]
DDHMQILLRKSTDGGAHWTALVSLARTDSGSDHPQLLARDGHIYLSWRTQVERYRLIDATHAVPANATLEAAL